MHTFPSLQFFGVPAQTALPHTSLSVHGFPSSHASVLSVCVHPDAGAHPSAVQTFPSSQLGAGPPTQTPPAHVSFVVHASPSVQAIVLFVCVHPDAGSQPSVVQTFPSSQFSAGPPTQTPPPQVSFVVHTLPSLQAAPLAMIVAAVVAGDDGHPSTVTVTL